MYTPLQVSLNSKIRNKKTVRQILHTVNHPKHWLCVYHAGLFMQIGISVSVRSFIVFLFW